MASPATLARLTARPTTTMASSSRVLAAAVRGQTRGYATPLGAPPANFRTSKQVRWHWDNDSLLDRMGKYFLLTEMARGMYVLLEQYFRPPYTIYYPFEKVGPPPPRLQP